MPKVESVEIRVIADQNPDISYLEQEGFEDRLKQFERGDFNFVGVRAVAEVEVGGTIQEITSAGLWGIESDSGDEYFRSVGKEEYAQLKEILTSMGIRKLPPFSGVRVKEYV